MTGHFIGYCPKTSSERIDLVVQREMLNWENEKVRDDVIAAACVGTTCYFAIQRTKKADNSKHVFATVCSTEYNPHEQVFFVQTIDEICGPVQDRCPLRVLRLLTSTGNEYALHWRQRCLCRLKRQRRLEKDGTIR